MKNATIEPRTYTQEDVIEKLVKPQIKAAHNYYLGMNKNHKCQFETFGEWKKEHPEHHLANKNYPNNEFVIVISQFFKYFNTVYDKPEEKKIVLGCGEGK